MSTAARVSRSDGYNRFSRFYDVDGKQYPSVTTILQAVAKPALVPWATKREREMILRAAQDLWEDIPMVIPKMSVSAYRNTLEARIGKVKAWQKDTDKACDIGSQAHARIEWAMRQELQQKVGPEPTCSEQALWAFMAYEDWRKKANLSPVLIEQTVWSHKHRFAGTLDWAGTMDHEGQRVFVVGDNKTGKAIYSEAHLQIAAYRHALIEMGLADAEVWGCILRLPKVESDPNFETFVMNPDQMKECFHVFLSVLNLWEWLDDRK